MNRWLERNHLKLTSRGERVIVSAIGTLIVVAVGLAFLFESFINSSNGVI